MIENFVLILACGGGMHARKQQFKAPQITIHIYSLTITHTQAQNMRISGTILIESHIEVL